MKRIYFTRQIKCYKFILKDKDGNLIERIMEYATPFSIGDTFKVHGLGCFEIKTIDPFNKVNCIKIS